MITCARRFRFEAAHRLYGHDGPCSCIHGHSWLVEVTANALELNKLGMIVDFGDLKKVVGGWLDDNWDHATLLHKGDPIIDLWRHGELDGHKLFSCLHPPTVEFLADYFLREVCLKLFKNTQVAITRVTVWETENCSATAEL